MSPRAMRSKSISIFLSRRRLNASRASRRTRLRVTAPPALRPSATINRPSELPLGAAYAVQEPIDTRCPERRIVPAGEFGRLLTVHVCLNQSDSQALPPLCPASPQHFLAVGCAHAFEKTVASLSFAPVRLIRPLHLWLLLDYWRSAYLMSHPKTCQAYERLFCAVKRQGLQVGALR